MDQTPPAGAAGRPQRRRRFGSKQMIERASNDADVPQQPWRVMELSAVAARWLLGGIFVYTGLEKVVDPVAFLKLVRQYDLFQSAFLLNAVAGALPWFEVFCGVLLVAGIAVRGSATALVGVLIPFTAVVWHRALVLQAAG